MEETDKKKRHKVQVHVLMTRPNNSAEKTR
jgi:hypothetical protein